MATTLSIPVPAGLDGGAKMGSVVDTLYGFETLWSLDARGPTFTWALPEGLFLNQSRGLMEFPLDGVPAGSTVQSARLRFQVQDFRVGTEGSLPSVDFDGYAGDGRLDLTDVLDPRRPVTTNAGLGTAPDTSERREYSIPLDAAFVESLVGRGAFLGVVAHGGQGTTIYTAEGAAAAGATPPTLVLTFTPPAQPVPATPLPSGTISGNVFYDTDADGVRDGGETATAKFVALLDANRNGRWDEGERTASTDGAGNYGFRGLAAGNYRLALMLPEAQPGWRQTAPAGSSYDVTLVTDASTAAGRDFGLHSDKALVAGTVYDDADGDGTRDAGEGPVAEARVVLDENNNGRFDVDDSSGFILEEPNTFTDQDGHYYFYNVAPGTQRVRLVPRADARTTVPAGGVHVLSLTAGQGVGRVDFGAATQDVPPPPPPPPPQTGSISGTVFNDRDRDGARDAGEGGVSNVRVYLDEDGDVVWDADEAFVFTDEGGNYTFGDLPAGAYRVCEELPDDLRATSPDFVAVTLAARQSVRGRNFGAAPAAPARGSITGTVFDDASGDGRRQAGEAALAGRRVYLDLNNDSARQGGEPSAMTDAAGRYRFTGLAAWDYRVRQELPAGWRVSWPASASHKVRLGTGATASGKDFADTRNVLVSGGVFQDRDGNGRRDRGEAVLPGWRVFIDADRDDRLDAGERSVLSDDKGNWSFGNLPAGTYTVAVVQKTGWRRTAPAAGTYRLTLAAGAAATGRQFGERRIG